MWAFGLQELQPSFPPSLGKDQVHPAAHSKQFKEGQITLAWDDSLRREDSHIPYWEKEKPGSFVRGLVLCYLMGKIVHGTDYSGRSFPTPSV